MPETTERGLLLDGHTYTQEEQQEFITRMRAANNVIYNILRSVGVHAFIEHSGLMSKYIDIASATMQAGVDFMVSNTHSEGALVIEAHDMGYLTEKLDCIYGPTLRANKEAREAFLRGLGLEDEVVLKEDVRKHLAAAFAAGQASAKGDADEYARKTTL